MDLCLRGTHRYIAKGHRAPFSHWKHCGKVLQKRLLLPLPNSCLDNCMLLFPKTSCLFGWRKYFWSLGLICCIRLRLCLNSHHVSPPWDSWSPAGRRGLLSKMCVGSLGREVVVGAQFILQPGRRKERGRKTHPASRPTWPWAHST